MPRVFAPQPEAEEEEDDDDEELDSEVSQWALSESEDGPPSDEDPTLTIHPVKKVKTANAESQDSKTKQAANDQAKLNKWRWLQTRQRSVENVDHSCPFGLSPYHPEYSSTDFGLAGGLREDLQPIASKSGKVYNPVQSRSQLICEAHPCLDPTMDEFGQAEVDRAPTKQAVHNQLAYFRRTFGCGTTLDVDPNDLKLDIIEGMRTQITHFSNTSRFQADLNFQGNLLRPLSDGLLCYPANKFRSSLSLGHLNLARLDLQRSSLLVADCEVLLQSTLLQVTGAGSLVLSRCEDQLYAHQVSQGQHGPVLQEIDKKSVDTCLWATVNPFLPGEVGALLRNGALELWDLQAADRSHNRRRGALLPPVEDAEAWGRVEYAWHPKVLLSAMGHNLFQTDLRVSQLCRKGIPLTDAMCGMAVNPYKPFEFALSSASQVNVMDARLWSRPVLSWNHHCESGPRQLQFLPSGELLTWTHREEIRMFATSGSIGPPTTLDRQTPFASNTIGCVVLPAGEGELDLVTLQANGSLHATAFSLALTPSSLPAVPETSKEYSDESDVDGPGVANSARRGPIRTVRAVHVGEAPRTTRTRYYVLDLTALLRYMVCGYAVDRPFGSVPARTDLFDAERIRQTILDSWAALIAYVEEEARTLCEIVCFLAAQLNLYHVLHGTVRTSSRHRKVEAELKSAPKFLIPHFAELAQVVAHILLSGPTRFYCTEIKRPPGMLSTGCCKEGKLPPRIPCGAQCELLHRLVYSGTKPTIVYPERHKKQAKAEFVDLSQDISFLAGLLSGSEEVPDNKEEEEPPEQAVDNLLADLGGMWKSWHEALDLTQ